MNEQNERILEAEIGDTVASGTLAEKQRADQLSINCRWLIDKIDRIHLALCPGQYGTWQQRAEQAVEAAERIVLNDRRKTMSETIEKPDAEAVDRDRLVRWEFVDEQGELFKWELRRTDGTSAATVWENGVWHTWSQDGSGGENSSQDCVTNAQMAAILSAINQGIITVNTPDPRSETI